MKSLLAVPVLLMLGSAVHAESFPSVEALLASIRAEYAGSCKTLEFGEEFAQPVRIDGDTLDDLLVDFHALQCDGSTMMFCGSGGCDMVLYLQQPDRSYRYLTGIFGYAIDFDRPDAQPPSFVAALHGNECDLSGMEPCSIRFKIEGGEAIEVGIVEQAEPE